MKQETATQANMSDSLMSMVLGCARHLTELQAGRKLIIHGAGARGIVLQEALKLLGHSASYFIDTKAKKEKGMLCCGLPVHEPIDVMYEDAQDIFVAVAASLPSEMIDALKGFGLEPDVNFGCVFDAALDNGSAHVPASNDLDFFLGYSRSLDLPGFECIKQTGASEGGPAAANILILGGSTTDPEVMDPIEWNDPELRGKSRGSWPRCFHELLRANGIDNQIYNGGTAGYCSAQELLKLLRDGLTIRPDLVIALDGINDGCSLYYHKDIYPKYHSHFSVVENIVRPLLSNHDDGRPVFNELSFGLPSKNKSWQEWYENQRIMKSICNEFGIEFVTFLQPFGVHDNQYLQSCDARFRTGWFLHNFFQSNGMEIRRLADANSLNLKTLLAKYVSDVFSYEIDHRNHFCFRYPDVEEFYSKALDLSESSDFIIPITDAFYGQPEILYDTAHCTSEGNLLIAERIYRELVSRGILINVMDRRNTHDKYLR